jgi:endo-1,4-beta-xylanase
MTKRQGWVVFVSLCLVVETVACSNDSAPAPAGDTITARVSALTGPIVNDFEDGTPQGWGARGGGVSVASVTAQAFGGTHSLLTTGRTAAFMGPNLILTGQLTKGAQYQFGVSVRLVAGMAPTAIKLTLQRTLTDGTNAFDTIAASSGNVTDSAWVTLTNSNYSFSTDVTRLELYVEAADPNASYYIDSFSLSQVAPAPLTADFEDGTPQGWVARPFGDGVVVANSIEQAAPPTGTHSLKTTGRTSGFNGPSLHVTGQLTKGATYFVTVQGRLVTGEAATTLKVTMQRTLTGGSLAFDTIVNNTNATDAAWVTMSSVYTLPNADVTDLLLYVESASLTASYFIDNFSITQLAPAPGPPANTTGAASTFEDGGRDSWFARTGTEVLTNTTADAHTGTHSLLTTGRTNTFRGPAFDVTNVMFNGSRYHVELWAKLAPGETSTQLKVSLDRKLGTVQETFTTLSGPATVTPDGWALFSTTFDNTLANTSLVLYVESQTSLASFYIDDFKITFIAPAVVETDIPSVWQAVADQFPVGSAVRAADLSGQSAVLLTKHFNSITSENDMKWDATEPTDGAFTFTNADPQVAFAKANNMRVRGHTLVWHNQIPAWVFSDPATGLPMAPSDANKALLIQRMRNHIQGVVTHFGTDVGTWDVVNEAIDPSQPDGYRRSPWFNIIGPGYIDIAFQAARYAAPTAKLYYNDFSTTDTTKLALIAALVSGMKSRGVPIDGVGHQMHNNVDFPSGAAVTNAINTIDALGVENSITELDVSIYSGSFSTPVLDYTNIPPDRFLLQGYRYLTFFQAFKQLQGKIKSVTFWGKADNQTWLTTSTQVDGPLLFDVSFKHKLAYWAVVDPLQLPGADLSTTMAAAPMTVPAGSAVAYTITVTNNTDTHDASFDPTDDDLPAANVALTTAVPANTTFQSLTFPTGWTCSQPAPNGTGPVRCTLPSLPAGASATFTLTVALANCAAVNGSTIAASANVTSTTADPNPAANNASSASIQVSNPPPVITATGPLDTTVECATSYTDQGATAQDACQGPVAVTPASTVDVAHVGDYTVTYTAADAAGSPATPVVRSVHVTDTTAPVVTVVGPNPATVECATSFADPGATAADTCVGTVPVTRSGAVDVGTPGGYTLGYSATDPSGNTGTASRLVTVRDTIPPSISIVAPIILGAPNHKYQSYSMTDFVTAVSDACSSGLGIADVVITRITSDEVEDGCGDGNTLDDMVIGADCRTAQLRVERSGCGNGRVYTVFLHVTDLAGNRTDTTVKVLVPVDAAGTTAVDDGPNFTVVSTCP